jgi:photosystem II stability/assembly factor-like uncharacterized protein
MKKYILLIILFSEINILSTAQPFDPSLFNSMKWRMIGPHRGGRTVGATGIPRQPNIFYIGVNNGGVWKTTDYGRTWFPIFDGQSTGSIGTITVAPSNPDIIYVGSGEGLHRPDLSTGNGIYKSTDAGKIWMHLGLQNGQQIPKIAVDPKNPDRIFVAVLGHPYGPNEERGIYRSTNGGKTFEKILYKDENTGGDDVTIDPHDPNIIFATLWESREGPWENGAWSGTGGGIYKSTDGGTTWKKLSKGLPENLVQAHIAIAPSSSSSSSIIYVAIGTTEPNDYGTGKGMGIYRSDDGGDNWKKISDDGRPEARIGGGDVPELIVDSKNSEIVYSTSIVVWRSVDGGKTWTGIRGAPGGDDYQNIWINPLQPNIMLVTGDQGAIITVNGGQTFSSWYNQPTAQIYHVSTDNAFPYNVYGSQQESGSIGIASRSNDGQITFHEWHPVGAQEYGYVAADPLDPNIIYGGKLSRFDKRTGQTQNIEPEAARSGKYRFLRTAPVLFSAADKKTLFYAGNVLFKTLNGGKDWQIISPDLSRESWDIPASVGIYTSDELKKMPRRGVIYTVAPSAKDINTIWCGTDDGLIHLTKDGGKTWKNVTPPAITSWSKISLMDASHFDVNTVYAAVNRIRLDDMHPHIYKTKDGGKTWKEIVNGLPDDPINVVREDPVRKGLLFAGSETAVYVSFDDGEHWQSLRLNMPATSIRDLVIKDDDLVIGTHGRSFWILDDMTSLRQLTNQLINLSTILYKPANAYRVRWNMWTDTPLPQEEPAGENPPDGAIIDYYLNGNAKNVSLEIQDAKGNIVRKYSNTDTMYKIPDVNIPLYWIRPQQILSSEKGSHRFLWDMRYTPLNVPPSYPISAVYKNTAPSETSPWVMPGTYIAKLTAEGKTYTQSFTVKMDPRVKTSVKDLQQQHDISLIVYRDRLQILNALNEVRDLRRKIKEKLPDATGAAITDLNLCDAQAAALEASPQVSKQQSFGSLNNSLASVFNILQESDMPATSQTIAVAKQAEQSFKTLWAQWLEVRKKIKACLGEK